ncbi:MAG: ATP-binding protein, partial [Cytophagales bacterium]|nr:ATP-binding protein [Cytophagales bacterium]
EQELPLYRLVQEIVNNALKHADAKSVIISINQDPRFSLVITDNGKGFDVQATKKDINKGVGLYNIENRVNMLRGQVELTSVLGQGTTYKVVIPADA